MQINGLGGVSAYNPYSSINKSTQMKSVKMPSFGWGFGSMPTATATNKSDEELKNAMIELAKKDARNGIFGQDLDTTLTKTRRSKEYEAIMGEYVQSVSPDRKSIFPAGIAQIGKATKLKGNQPLIDDSLTQLILNGAKIGLKSLGVQYDAKSKMTEIHCAMFTSGGEDIGSYSITYGWGWCPTKEEQSRYVDMGQLYLDTWRSEAKQMQSEGQTINPDVLKRL